MLYFPLILLILIALALITRPFTVLFHELGHAIPAILLTREKVTIYIGSYGDPINSIKFKIGLLEIYFRYNPFLWRRGLCVPTAKGMSINSQILYTLTGPLASFVIASFACYFTFLYDFHGAIKLVLVIFLASSVLDLIINLVPRSVPIKLYDGSFTYNDGYALKRLFYLKRFPKDYASATDLYNQKKYAEAACIFDMMLTTGVKDAIIYQLAISSYKMARNYKEAKRCIDNFVPLGQMTGDDFCNAGFVYSNLGLHVRALEFYDNSLLANPNHKYSLNNKGYTLNLMERFSEAVPLFEKAVEIDPDFAYSYNNRGLAKIKLGFEEQGLADINHSLELDKDNAYGYMHLGIYHYDRGEYKDALRLFKKAKDIDNTTYMIDEFILKTENKFA